MTLCSFDRFFEVVVQFNYCLKVLSLHDNLGVIGHHLFKLCKVSLLQQEHHVISQNVSIPWAHIDSLFKCNLRIVHVALGLLEGKSQVAKGLLVVWLDFKCV